MKILGLWLFIVAVLSLGCPNMCNGHGSCNRSGTCQCFPEFMGADCSLSIFIHLLIRDMPI